jgi:hypothetical protein
MPNRSVLDRVTRTDAPLFTRDEVKKYLANLPIPPAEDAHPPAPPIF